MRIKTVFLLLSFPILFLLSGCSGNHDDIGLQKNDISHENTEGSENMLGRESDGDGAIAPYEGKLAKVVEVESDHVLLVEIIQRPFSDDSVVELVSEIPNDVERGVSFEVEVRVDGAVFTSTTIIYLFEGDIARLEFDKNNERVSRAINLLDVGTLIEFYYAIFRDNVFDYSGNPFVVQASGITVLRETDGEELEVLFCWQEGSNLAVE